MNPVSNYALFFTRSYFIAPFILYILLAVLLLTFGWRRAGKLHNPRSTHLLRAFLLALVFTPALAFMDGATFLPFLLAVFIMIISPFGFSLSTALILPVVNILTLLAGWGIFHLILNERPYPGEWQPGRAPKVDPVGRSPARLCFLLVGVEPGAAGSGCALLLPVHQRVIQPLHVQFSGKTGPGPLLALQHAPAHHGHFRLYLALLPRSEMGGRQGLVGRHPLPGPQPGTRLVPVPRLLRYARELGG